MSLLLERAINILTAANMEADGTLRNRARDLAMASLKEIPNARLSVVAKRICSGDEGTIKAYRLPSVVARFDHATEDAL